MKKKQDYLKIDIVIFDSTYVIYGTLIYHYLQQNIYFWFAFTFFSKCIFCCCCSVTETYRTLCDLTVAWKAPLSFTNIQSLLRCMSIELMVLSNQVILCCFLLFPANFPSIRVFSNELALVSHRQSIGASAIILTINMEG